MFGFCLCRFWLPPQYTATGSLYVSIPGSESADPRDRLRGPHRRSKAGQDLLGSPWRATGFWIWRHSSWLRTAPQRTCGLWSPHPAWGTRKPSLFLSPTETLRLPRSLPTPSWTPPRLKFSDRPRPGRMVMGPGAVLPVQPDAPTLACRCPCSLRRRLFGRSGRRPCRIPGEAQAHSPAPAAGVCRNHGVTEGRAD